MAKRPIYTIRLEPWLISALRNEFTATEVAQALEQLVISRRQGRGAAPQEGAPEPSARQETPPVTAAEPHSAPPTGEPARETEATPPRREPAQPAQTPEGNSGKPAHPIPPQERPTIEMDSNIPDDVLDAF